MKNIKTTKIIAFFMAVLMILPMVPVVDLTVYAVGEEYYANIKGTAVFNPTVIYDPSGMVYITDTPENGLDYTDPYTLDAGELDAIKKLNMVIEDCYVGDGGYWYKVKTADGSDLPGKLADKSWIYQNDIPTSGYPDVLIVTPPPVTPETPEISATVKDANGKDVTVKVEGDLPEGATLAVSVPTVGGEALPNVFDIKVYDKNGNEWQPADGQTVALSIPVEGDIANVVHFIDYAPALMNNSNVKYLSLDAATAEELELLKAAISASDRPGYVAVEELNDLPVENGYITFATNSFSIYLFWQDAYYDAGDDWESYNGYANKDGKIDLETIQSIPEDDLYIYYIEKGDELRLLFPHHRNYEVGELYKISSPNRNHEQYINGPSETTTGGIFGIGAKHWVVFTAKNVTLPDSGEYMFYITFHMDGEPVSTNKTIVVKVVDNIPDEDIKPSGNIPLYIGIYTGDGFPAEPTTDMSKGYQWYKNGKVESTIVKYSDSSNSMIATEVYESSALMVTGTNVTAIIDNEGIRTLPFVNISESFKREVVAKIGGVEHAQTNTLLIYAVKRVTTSNNAGYYVMCKVIPVNSITVTYNPNTPTHFDESDLAASMPDAQIAYSGAKVKLKGPSEPQFSVEINQQTEFINFVGWSTNPNAKPSDCPSTPVTDDEWYEEGDEVELTENLALYAIWANTKSYQDATIEFYNHVVDQNGDLIVGGEEQFTFEVSNNLVGYNYSIHDEMGAALSTGTFSAQKKTFSLKNGWFIIIKNVPNNPSGNYTITQDPPTPGFVPEAGSTTTTITITEAKYDQDGNIITDGTNVAGEFLIDYYNVLQSFELSWNIDGVITKQTYSYGAKITPLADPSKVGYTFDGWDIEIPATMPAENVTITAMWTINQYTITFDTDGGSTIAPITQNYGTAVTAPANPTKPGYTFAGWDKAIPATMPVGGVTVKAKWTPNQYTITFNTDGGTEISSITQNFGTAITPPANPTKTGFDFAGWEPAIPATMPAEDITVKARWTIKQHTIQFVNEGGAVLQTGKWEYGSTPKYNGETPTKAPDAENTYTFAGWSPAIVAVTGDATYTAAFAPHKNKYIITFVNDDGTVLEKKEWEYGSKPAYNGTPTKPATDQYTYIFDGWTTEICAVTGEATYRAKYKEIVNKYTVTWIVDGNTTTEEYEYGETPSFKGSTDKASDAQYTYTFAGWSPAIVAVTGDATYTATYTPTVNKYTITWIVDGNTTTEEYKYGATPSFKGSTDKASDAQFAYTFSGWSPALTSVTGEATYTAQFDAVLKSYTITWIVDGNTTTEEYKYGATPSFKGSTDKAADAQYTYTFAGWSPAIVAVTGDATYTATYTPTVNKYTITWIVDGNTTTKEYEYGEDITAPANPTKPGHTFTGWDKNFPFTVTQNETITAQWEEIKVTVTYVIVAPAGAVNYGSINGNITQITQTVDVVTGQPSATVTVNAPKFKFVGWYLDEACTQPVPSVWVRDAQINPGKTKDYGNGVMGFESAIYYAKFAYNLTTLTITTTGADAIDHNQTFIFNIQGFGGVDLDVTVHGNDKVKIDGLTVGQEYTVTAKTNWSWRYDVANAVPAGSGDVIGIIESSRVGNSSSLTITLGVNGEVLFTFTRGNSQWLDGDSWCDNRFMANVTPEIN